MSDEKNRDQCEYCQKIDSLTDEEKQHHQGLNQENREEMKQTEQEFRNQKKCSTAFLVLMLIGCMPLIIGIIALLHSEGNESKNSEFYDFLLFLQAKMQNHVLNEQNWKRIKSFTTKRCMFLTNITQCDYQCIDVLFHLLNFFCLFLILLSDASNSICAILFFIEVFICENVFLECHLARRLVQAMLLYLLFLQFHGLFLTESRILMILPIIASSKICIAIYHQSDF